MVAPARAVNNNVTVSLRLKGSFGNAAFCGIYLLVKQHSSYS